jgi:hypothetical protein
MKYIQPLLCCLVGLIAGVSLHSFYISMQPKEVLPTKCIIKQHKSLHQYDCTIEQNVGVIEL